MSRFEEIKRLDKKSRNKLRAILSDGEVNAINALAHLRGRLGKDQANALEEILSSSVPLKAVRRSIPFPMNPPFKDSLQAHRRVGIEELLGIIETNAVAFKARLLRVATSFHRIDEAYAIGDVEYCRQLICDSIAQDGWSHAILRRIVLIRENRPEGKADEKIEELLQQADLKAVLVSSLIHSYSVDQNYVTIKRSILNISDRGVINRYSRTVSRLPVQPFAKTGNDLAAFLLEVEKCSLVDAIILAKFNSHLFRIEDYPTIEEIANKLGQANLFERLVATYDADDHESEYAFFKQCSAWLEYEPVRQYRALLDNYYDTSTEDVDELPDGFARTLHDWVGNATLSDLVGKGPFTKHPYRSLAKLELSGGATRSAMFNYWLYHSDGQIGFEREDLLTLMGLTRDLARTVPIKAVRTAARLAKDGLVRLILLLLLAKRSKNELDSFHLRKLLEDITIKDHGGSLVKLVEASESTHPAVATYIYDIATEDFLAKLNKLVPHRADIPEVRASLHEWMARFTIDEHYLQRARAVRIDHQLNRVRNEIDDHRIYVDPSRFSCWIEDEMMIELNSALTSTGSGKKGICVNCNETILSLVMKQCYNAFCSNSVFGIASYIGRRIRHGTFHGHLYSSIINQIEKNEKFQLLFRSPLFTAKWNSWKDAYNKAIEEIIRDRLHVYSKAKPLGLLQPEVYGTHKLEILSAAVKNISINYTETKSVIGIDQIIIDYCWRLAEGDLINVTRFLKAQQTPLKNLRFLENELLPSAAPTDAKLADAFRRDLVLTIDRKLAAMFGWFKRPTIVAPKASLSLLFDAIVAEVKDTIPEFNPQEDQSSNGDIELVGGVYHIVYDSLAVVVANAAKHGERSRPVRRSFVIPPGKEKQLIVEISSSIRSSDNPIEVSAIIERRKKANFQDANLYQGKSGISKLMLLAHARHDFFLEQYEVVGNEVKVRLAYALEH
ncbi:MAG: hypothetical protein AW10_01205 [Candidatus Accumulibacter appositus]|uniref:Uncharacterized protein n=1 Tax=Candidatus Accumulibacter appositus TaxID=1454003 RepID=A0A011NFA8_9PROT|nr:MAG: hypothetical protein AW10_01205 [Candidatus Accumulibacter appositus]